MAAAAAVALHVPPSTMNEPYGNFAMLPSRPQVGIGRLPVRRQSNESKQSMNCKSCRKRKVSISKEGGKDLSRIMSNAC